MEYLDLVPGEAGEAVALLRDRIYRAAAGAGSTMAAPPFPFAAETVAAAPSAPAGARLSSAASAVKPCLHVRVEGFKTPGRFVEVLKL